MTNLNAYGHHLRSLTSTNDGHRIFSLTCSNTSILFRPSARTTTRTPGKPSSEPVRVFPGSGRTEFRARMTKSGRRRNARLAERRKSNPSLSRKKVGFSNLIFRPFFLLFDHCGRFYKSTFLVA